MTAFVVEVDYQVVETSTEALNGWDAVVGALASIITPHPEHLN